MSSFDHNRHSCFSLVAPWGFKRFGVLVDVQSTETTDYLVLWDSPYVRLYWTFPSNGLARAENTQAGIDFTMGMDLGFLKRLSVEGREIEKLDGVKLHLYPIVEEFAITTESALSLGTR